MPGEMGSSKLCQIASIGQMLIKLCVLWADISFWTMGQDGGENGNIAVECHAV